MNLLPAIKHSLYTTFVDHQHVWAVKGDSLNTTRTPNRLICRLENQGQKDGRSEQLTAKLDRHSSLHKLVSCRTEGMVWDVSSFYRTNQRSCLTTVKNVTIRFGISCRKKSRTYGRCVVLCQTCIAEAAKKTSQSSWCMDQLFQDKESRSDIPVITLSSGIR